MSADNYNNKNNSIKFPFLPQPPSHGTNFSRLPASQNHLNRSQSVRSNSTATPGADNLGASAAGGGIAGIAVGVAHSNQRRSGVDAMVNNNNNNNNNSLSMAEEGSSRSLRAHDSNNSQNIALNNAMEAPGQSTPGGGSSSTHLTPSERSIPAAGFYDDPYQRHHSMYGPGNPEAINPHDIVDDGDEGFLPAPQRRSVLSFGRNNSSRNSLAAGTAGATGAGAGAGAGAGVAAGTGNGGGGGMIGAISDRVNGQTTGDPNGGPVYDAVPSGAGAGAGGKKEWNPGSRRKKITWIVCIAAAIILVGAIVGGSVGGILGNRSDQKTKSGPGKTAKEDESNNGDLGKESSEIKALMNNPDLHKVFPGVDYTPWGTQYPLCVEYPPSQNNVTRDIAVLSQLTNTIRLYGTDCNQTEMVLHALDRLDLKKDMKIWLGVWIDTNTTTNDRQMQKLHDVIEKTEDKSIFKGAIIGNEVLFRGSKEPEKTMSSLEGYINDVKKEFEANNLKIPVATSDLGDNWTKDLAKLSDVVMANVHPFFGGVPIDQAASWTYSFWTNHNVDLTKGTDKQNIISEVGWPSSGGNDCAPKETCPDKDAGAVAGVDQMNQFMSEWVCQAMKNGTDYFWYVIADEILLLLLLLTLSKVRSFR